MNNLFKKIATAFVGIAMAIGVGVAVGGGNVREAKAEGSYTFTFSANTAPDGTGTVLASDHSTALTTSNFATNGTHTFKSGATYYWLFGGSENVKTVSSIANCYPGANSSLKVGKSAEDGTFALTIDGDAGIYITSVVVTAYGNANTAKITIDEASEATKTWTLATSSGSHTFEYQDHVDTITLTGGAGLTSKNKVAYITQMVVNYAIETNPLVSVDKDNLYFKVNGDGQQVTATPTNFTPTSYSWAVKQGSDDCVELSNANTATVTISPKEVEQLSTTTVVVTASDGNASETAEVEVVVDPKGIEDAPYTVAEARARIDANYGLENAYVQGVVSRYFLGKNETLPSVKNGKLSYYISDDGTETDEIEAYLGLGLNGAEFTSVDDVKPGDVVIIKGNLTKYNSTYELAEDNELVWQFRYIPVESITLASETFTPVQGVITLHVGDEQGTAVDQLTATVLPANASEQEVEFKTSNPQIAEVDEDGYVTIHTTAAGSAVITVSSVDDNTVNATMTYTVEEPAPETYTVSFNANGGTGEMLPVNNITSGTQYTLPQCGFSRSGYEFLGWALTADGEVIATETISITEDVTLFAKWQESEQPPVQPTLYTVSFNANGGNGSMNPKEDIEEGSEYTLPACDFTREGYTFAGWALSANGQAIATETIEINQNVELFALWQENEQPGPTLYTVSFDANGGTGTMNPVENLEAGYQYTLPQCAFTKEGFTFDGWALTAQGEKIDDTKIEVNANITLYALWQEEIGPAPFDGVIYTKVTEEMADYSGKYLIVCEESDVVFDGSLSDLDAVNTPNRKEAELGENTINVEEEADNFYFVIAKMEGGYSIKAANGKYIGGQNGANKVVSSTEALLNTISVEDGDAAIVSDTSVLRYNSASNSLKFRYFKAATYSAQKAVQLYRAPGDAPVDPTPEKVNITFNSNGGTAVATQQIDKGAKATQPTAPTKDGYTFAGWYSDEGLTTAYDFDAAVNADLTLYAKWTENDQPQPEKVTVTFNSNGGSAVQAQEINKGAKATQPTAPTRDGYTFAGWYSDEALTTAFDFNSVVNANVTLYAKWTENGGDTPTPTPSEDVVDNLTMEWTGVYKEEGAQYASYQDWSDKTLTSGAKYAGNTCWNDKNAIQLRSDKNKSGIVVAAAPQGKVVKSVKVAYDASTPDARQIDIYGSDTAYTAPSELFADATKGELLGSIKKTDTDLTFELTTAYEYIGIRSNNGALYLSELKITWKDAPSEEIVPTGISLDKTTAEVEVGKTVSLKATLAPAGAKGTITWESSDTTVATVTNGTVTGVKVGTAKITAKCGELKAECTVTVKAAPEAESITVAKALELCAALGDNKTSDAEYKISGKVKSIKDAYSSEYGNISFEMVDNANDENSLLVYRLKCTAEEAEKIVAGADIVIQAKLKNYKSSTEGSTNVLETDAGGKLISVGGDTPTPTPTTTYTVTFNSNGGSAVAAQTVNSGAKATKPADPTREGYTFGGWYTDEACTQAFNFDTAISANITLYAKWTAVQPEPSADATLVAIKILSNPTKTTYKIGESIDLTGLRVALVYSDGVEKEIAINDTSLVYTMQTPTAAGQYEVKVTYVDLETGQTKEATFVVNFNRDKKEVIGLGCHGSVVAGSALISLTSLIGAGLLMLRKRKIK